MDKHLPTRRGGVIDEKFLQAKFNISSYLFDDDDDDVCVYIITVGGEVRAGCEDDARTFSHSQQHPPRLCQWKIFNVKIA